MGEAPKYARLENERRFLVDPDSGWRLHVKPYSKLFQDRYLDGGRLRLRRLQDSDTGRVAFKLTKKYASESSFSQPIVSVQLSLAEYEALAGLPGRNLTKTRHYDEYEGCLFSIDVFQGGLAGLILCETEAETPQALQEMRFPPYARWEVTEESLFTGGSLCRGEWPEVEAAIARVKAR
jgi:CYTH domain-containing protein